MDTEDTIYQTSDVDNFYEDENRFRHVFGKTKRNRSL
jgi:hypothetical protein